jgi:hypothetical protein
MQGWLGLLTILLTVADKVLTLFNKTPSEKIAKKKVELRDKMDKYKNFKKKK